jgi:hypothetical protein
MFTVAIKLGFRMKPKQSLLAFCDEASHNCQRYFVLGAVYFALNEGADADQVVTTVEQDLTNLKAKYDLGTVKWQKVPTRDGKYLDGYKALIQDFLETASVYFKCIVIDTHKYPLGNAKLWSGDILVGYQKFYCVFLADGLMQRYPGYYYQVVVDQFAGCVPADLEKSVEGRYVKKVKPTSAMYHCDVKSGDETTSALLQLTDLLVGAVAFAWNGGMERTTPRASVRQELVKLLEARLTISLSKATSWSTQKFNIWEFTPNPLPTPLPG